MNFQKKYNNKEILIIGGGTSTLDRNWEAIVNEDTFVWTCNDFYKNERVNSQNIDLYQLGFLTDIQDDSLIHKLKENKPFTYFEPEHYRGKQKTEEFKSFQKKIGYSVPGMNIDYSGVFQPTDRWKPGYGYRPAQKSGATFRLILLALATNARNIYFIGFDGFNREFSNKHAFTGQVGLKDTDTRRDYDNSELSYVNVFEDAFRLLAGRKDNKRLQNLGEGLDYNLGTRLSKEYFPLKQDIYEAIR